MKNLIKSLSLLLSLLLIAQIAFSQTNQVQSSKYNRNSMSFHFVQFRNNNTFSSEYLQNVDVPEKFDDNSFGNNLLPVDISKTRINEDINSEILASIQSNRIPNKILKKILLDANGIPTTKTLSFRGEYSATDADFIKAHNSKEGISLLRQNGIENMLKNIYFVVNDTYGIESKYSRESKSIQYTLSYKSYLYKIDLDALLNTEFWETFWWEGDNQEKLNYFMNYNFPVIFITSVVGSVGVSDKNTSRDIVYQLLLDNMIDDEITSLSKNHDPLKVKTTVFKTRPISSKIGKKEGLQPDDLYQILENRERQNGKKYVSKQGHVRANKVFDNRKISSGNSGVSTFYKATARSVKQGMVMKEVPEAGFIIGTEIAYNIEEERFMPTINIDYITHAFRGSRLSISYAYDEAWGNVSYAEIKQELQLNRLSIMPSIGYVYFVDYKVSGYTGAIKLGLNLGKYFQINLGPRVIYYEEPILFITAGIRLFGF